MKHIVTLLLFCLIFCSCAHDKDFVIDGKTVTVHPYGWANADANKDDRIIYEASIGNVVWSILGFELMLIPPVVLTGWYLYEPVRCAFLRAYRRERSGKDNQHSGSAVSV